MNQPSRNTPGQTQKPNDGKSSKSDKGINLIIGVFLLVTGIFSVMFHFILFPLIGIFVGIPLLIAGAVFVIKHRRRDPGYRSEYQRGRP
jgi:uncharacterized membrane protein HdeD (DUF308 family)